MLLLALGALAIASGPPGGEQRTPPPAPAAASMPPARGIETGLGEPRRLAMPARRAAAQDPAGQELVWRGRCVAAETGAPLAGCEVSLYAPWGSQALAAAYGAVGLERQPQVTGGDGVFAFPVTHRRGRSYYLVAKAPGRVGRHSHWRELPDSTDVGDLAMRRGATVRGRVVDRDGTPVADVAVGVMVDGPHVRLDANDLAVSLGLGRSGEDGRFTSEAVPPGSWPLRVHAGGGGIGFLWSFPIVEPARLEIPAGATDVDLRLVVDVSKRPREIGGLVVDERGQPVEGVEVRALDGMANPREAQQYTVYQAGYTGSDGSFRIREAQHCRVYGLRVVEGPRTEGTEHSSPVAWGTEGLRLQVHRKHGVTCKVRDVDGAPLERFGVWLSATDPTWPTYLRHAGSHEGGEVELWGGRGQHVRIVPERRDLAPCDVDMPRGDDAVVVRVAPCALLAVCVETEGGEPFAGTGLELIERRRVDPAVDERAVFEDPAAEPWTEETSLQVSRAVTNEHGRGTLRVADRRADLVLRAAGPGHLPLEQDVSPADVDRGELRLVPRRGSVLRAKLRPASVLRDWGAKLVLVDLDRHGSWPAEGGVAVPEDGDVELAGLPAGRWRVGLVTGFPCGTELGAIEVGPGDTAVERLYDLAGLAPVDVTLQLTLGGSPLDTGPVRVLRREPGVPGREQWSWAQEVPVQGDGTARVRLPPGECAAYRFFDFGTREHWIYRTVEAFRVRAGAARTVECALEPRKCRVRFVDGATGEAIDPDDVRIEGDFLHYERDGDAVVLWTPPAARYVARHDGRRADFAADDGLVETRLEVTIPAR